MNPKLVTILSLNVGMSSTLAGLPSLVSSEKIDIIFLQEVKLNSLEIERQLPGYCAEANLDPTSSSKPGTAIVWLRSLPVTNIHSFSTCRIQVITI